MAKLIYTGSGCRVCLPDIIIDLNERTIQKELAYLYSMKYPGIEPDEDTPPKKGKNKEEEGE